MKTKEKLDDLYNDILFVNDTPNAYFDMEKVGFAIEDIKEEIDKRDKVLEIIKDFLKDGDCEITQYGKNRYEVRIYLKSFYIDGETYKALKGILL